MSHSKEVRDNLNSQEMMRQAEEANLDLQAFAALIGVNYSQLISCIVQQIGIVGIIACLRKGGNFLECLMQNVKIEDIFRCVGGSVSDGEF